MLKYILCFLLGFFLLADTAIASSNKTERYGLSEPFFIETANKETLADYPLLTIDNQHYVPIVDVADALGFRATLANNVVSFLPGESGIAMEDSPLPKKQVHHPNDKVTFDTAVNGGGAVIIEGTADKLVYGKNAHTHFYPASTLKILTALLAIERGNLDTLVTVSHHVSSIPYDSSKAFIKPGDRITLRDLLYGLMIPSGNDAAVAVAEHIAGSEEAFVKLMNARAKELGARRSNFTNSHGYDDPKQVSTPYDIGVIMLEAAKHDFLRKLISTPSYTARFTNKDGKTARRTWKATNQQIRPESSYYAPNLIGGKTGYTSTARHNIVSAAEHNGKLYAMVVLRGNRNERYQDVQRMLALAVKARAAYDVKYKERFHITNVDWRFSYGGHAVGSVKGMFVRDGRLYVPVEALGRLLANEMRATLSPASLKTTVDGRFLFFGANRPIVKDGSLLVPAGTLLEHFGMTVQYDGENRTLIGIKERSAELAGIGGPVVDAWADVSGTSLAADPSGEYDAFLKIMLGSPEWYLNGTTYSLGISPEIIGDKTYVPLRIIGEGLGGSIDWGIGRTLVLE